MFARTTRPRDAADHPAALARASVVATDSPTRPLPGQGDAAGTGRAGAARALGAAICNPVPTLWLDLPPEISRTVPRRGARAADRFGARGPAFFRACACRLRCTHGGNATALRAHRLRWPSPRCGRRSRPNWSGADGRPDGVLPLPWPRALARGGAGHAARAPVLIHGLPGIGQWQLTTLAQARLCEDRAGAAPVRPLRLWPAGAGAHSHPDLLVLLPEALQAPLGWTLADSERGRRGRRQKQPSKEIKVEAVRGAVAFAQTTPRARRAGGGAASGRAHERHVRANALLKTLEEPAGPPRASSSAARRPRPCCRPYAAAASLRAALPAEAQAAAVWLAEAGRGADHRCCWPPAAAVDALRERVREGLDARLWQQLPALMQRGDATAMTGWPIPRAVDALQKLCHDVACVSVGAARALSGAGAAAAG